MLRDQGSDRLHDVDGLALIDEDGAADRLVDGVKNLLSLVVSVAVLGHSRALRTGHLRLSLIGNLAALMTMFDQALWYYCVLNRLKVIWTLPSRRAVLIEKRVMDTSAPSLGPPPAHYNCTLHLTASFRL